jgi:hypothetical protein
MDTPLFTPLDLMFLLCSSGQQKNVNVVGDHSMNIYIKFGSNWPSGFREEH